MTLLEEISAYLRKTNISKSYFGKIAVGNSAVVGRLEAGRPILVDTADRIREFMRDNPEGAPRRRGKKIADSPDPRNALDSARAGQSTPDRASGVSTGNARSDSENLGVRSNERKPDPRSCAPDDGKPPGQVA